jgi:hypothetical protein
MNVFISQTKGKSREVAQALQDWLRDDMRICKPWLSEDIQGGENWRKAINEALTQARFGIICITADNLTNQWIILEAGVLDIRGIKVFPYIIDLDKRRELPSPIRHIQGRKADCEGTKDLVFAINKALDSPVSEAALEKAFNFNWKKLEKRLKAIVYPPVSEYEKLIDDFVKIFMNVDEYRRSLNFSPVADRIAGSITGPGDYDREAVVANVHRIIEESRERFDRESYLVGNVRDFFKEKFTKDHLREIVIRLEPILLSGSPPDVKLDELKRRIKIEELEIYLGFQQVLVDKLRERIVEK